MATRTKKVTVDLVPDKYEIDVVENGFQMEVSFDEEDSGNWGGRRTYVSKSFDELLSQMRKLNAGEDAE